MLSTNIILQKHRSAYWMDIIGGPGAFSLKFDTGAVYTIISIEILFGDIPDTKRSALISYIKKKRYLSKEFTVASGHTIKAYPTVMSDVVIGDITLPEFYYYLVVDKLENDKKTALLGDNFIDCCEYSCSTHGNIHISKFDKESYKFDSSHLSTNEILAEIS